MAPSKSNREAAPGTFQPNLPGDAAEVVKLFAIAGRAVIAKPEAFESVSETLAAVIRQLVPPERLAAEDCARLWGLFGRMAERKKAALLEEGGRALYRDLDAIGQKLSLPPLDDWATLPEGIRGRHPVKLTDEPTDQGESVEQAKKKARLKAKKRGDPPLAATIVLKLVAGLADYAREEMFKALIGEGALQKSDTVLIEQVVKRGGKIGEDDDLLAAGLVTIGRWLVR